MTKRQQKKLIATIVTFVLAVIVLAAQGKLGVINTTSYLHNEPGSYQVAQFVDGDTIRVNIDGTIETIRFIGMDTPETHKPNTPVQCYGPAAAAYTKNRIGTQRVRLVADDLTSNRDRYNRLLRYVVLEDGTYLNLELVRKGYAFSYDSFPSAKTKEIDALMTQARTDKVGLWKNCHPYQDPKTGQWHTETAT
jgi:micrococcal nuclease